MLTPYFLFHFFFFSTKSLTPQLYSNTSYTNEWAVMVNRVSNIILVHLYRLWRLCEKTSLKGKGCKNGVKNVHVNSLKTWMMVGGGKNVKKNWPYSFWGCLHTLLWSEEYVRSLKKKTYLAKAIYHGHMLWSS